MIRRAALLTFLCTLGVYVSALCPGAYWLDSSEFAASTFTLGVAQPPGHPVHMLWGKLFTLLPLGPIAFRVGLGQAVAAALGAAFLCATGALLSLRMMAALRGPVARPAYLLASVLGGTSSLYVSLGYAVAFQSVRPEVYAFHGMLAMAAVFFLLRYDESADRRHLLLGTLMMGLGLANHHYLMILTIVPVPILLLREGRGTPRAILQCFAVGAIGLLFYVYLPLRAAHHPLVNWGSPTTWKRIFWVISAAPFQKSVRPPQEGDDELIGAMIDAVNPIGAVLAVIGVYLLVRQRKTRRLGIFLLASALVGAMGRYAQGFDTANPDAYGYLIPALYLVGLCAAAGATGFICVAFEPGGRAGMATAAVLLLGAVIHGGISYPRIDLSRFWDLDILIGAVQAEAPPRSWLISTNFQTLFGLWYLRGVEGQRPDVLHFHPHFLNHPGYRDQVLLLHPGPSHLAEVLGPFDVVPDALLAARADRPILIEFDIDTQPVLLPHLYPLGLSESIEQAPRPAAGAGDQAALAQRRREQAFRMAGTGEQETARNLMWRSYLSMVLACRTDDPPRFREELGRVQQLLRGGHSPEIDELLQHCRH